MFILTLLSACWNKEKIENHLNNLEDNKSLINVDEKVEQAKKELENIWLTWQALKDEIYNQKIIYEKIANLTWDERNSYILQNQILPDILQKKEAEKCKNTTDIDLFAKCMIRQGIVLQDIEKLLPENTIQTFEKKYYKSFYSFDKRNLLTPNTNSIALQAKKDEIFSLISNWILTQPMCNDLPEKEIKDYCTNLFKYDNK